MLKKVFLVVDVDNEEQKEAIQQIMNDVSNMRMLQGGKIVSLYPFVKKHQNELYQIFRIVADGGVKSLLSPTGMNVISKLIRK